MSLLIINRYLTSVHTKNLEEKNIIWDELEK